MEATKQIEENKQQLDPTEDNNFIDLNETKRFLKLLEPEAEHFLFRVFDDNKDRSKQLYPGNRYGTLARNEQWLKAKNLEGCGVFLSVNPTVKDSVGKIIVTHARAVWIEDDQGDAPDTPLKPHIVVESSPGKYHKYFLTEPLDKAKANAMQEVLVAKYGSDPNAKDWTRVLRLPGFAHQKVNARKGQTGSPFTVRIIEVNDALPRYTKVELEQAFDFSIDTAALNLINADMPANDRDMETATSSKILAGLNNYEDKDLVANLISAIDMIDMADRTDWLNAGIGIKHAVNMAKLTDQQAYDIWNDVSAEYDNYDGADQLRTWQSLNPTGDITVASIFYHAALNGWVHLSKRPYYQLSNRIEKRLATDMKLKSEVLNNVVEQPVVKRMITTAFWLSSKSKICYIGVDGRVKNFNEQDAKKFLIEDFGAPFDTIKLNSIINDYTNSLGSLNDQQRAKRAAEIRQLPINMIIDYVKHKNQHSRVNMRVDYFAEHSYVEIKDDGVDLVFSHKAHVYKANGIAQYDKDRIIRDYKDHFKLVDDVLTFLVNARFAADRKKAYLWFLCQSDWGKGFFMSALTVNGLCVQLSLKELEAIFSGSPVGKTMDDFRGALAVAFDEFKKSNAELKQIQSSMTISPKHELSCTVQLHAKLFFSAENNLSLAGEQGVEPQYSKRFSLLKHKGDLSARELFKEVGSGLYFEVIANYIGEYIESASQHMIGLGRRDAEKIAGEGLNRFHGEHGIASQVDSLEDKLIEIAEEIRGLVVHAESWRTGFFTGNPLNNYPNKFNDMLCRNIIVADDQCIYLKSPQMVVSEFNNSMASFTSKGSLGYKTSDIADLLGEYKSRSIQVGGSWKTYKAVDLQIKEGVDMRNEDIHLDIPF